MTRRFLMLLGSGAGAHAQLGAADWTPLFDGKTLQGWRETPFPGRGKVEVRNGTLVLGRGRMTGVTWTGEFPKVGYEIRFEAARLEGKDFFGALTFPYRETYCTFVAGGWDGSVVGLSNVDDYDASENETSTNRDFVNGRWYGFRLLVTEARIQAWIDEALTVDIETAKRKLSLRFDDTDLSAPLGFSSYATVGAIRNIAYRTAQGRGNI